MCHQGWSYVGWEYPTEKSDCGTRKFSTRTARYVNFGRRFQFLVKLAEQVNPIHAGQKEISAMETRVKDGILVPKNIPHRSSGLLSLKLSRMFQTTATARLLLSKLNHVVTTPILLSIVFLRPLPVLRCAIITTSSQEFRRHPFSLTTTIAVPHTIQVRPLTAQQCPIRLHLHYHTTNIILTPRRLTQTAVVAVVMTKMSLRKIDRIRTDLPPHPPLCSRSAHVARIQERLTLSSLWLTNCKMQAIIFGSMLSTRQTRNACSTGV